MVIEEETGNTARLEPILIGGLSKQIRRRRREAENSNGEQRENTDLLREAKLGSHEEEVSLLIKMGSMVAVAFVPAGGGTVDGLAEDAQTPMLAAGAMCSAQACGRRRKMKCGERGKVTPSLLFIVKLSHGSRSNAPTIPVSCGSNGRTTCPTSCGGRFDPITA